MSKHKSCLLACLVGLGALLLAAPQTIGQQKKKDGVLLSKTDSLADTDAKDTKMKDSYCKTYKIKMTEGKAYKIDLSSKDFDTFLRVENAAGKELAFHDDIDFPKNTNSRLIFVAPKTAEYTVVATTFKGSETGEFKLEIKNASPAEAAQALLVARVIKTASLGEGERKKLIADVTKHLEGKAGKLTIEDVQITDFLTGALEQSDIPLAIDACMRLGKVLAGADNAKVVAAAKPFTMVGKQLKIAGKTVNGKDFDLKNMKGKVVLVDFWATWCGPCVGEIPNIKKAHEKYHGKGFDVIGITLDRPGDTDKVAKFMEDRKMPWGCIDIEDSRKLATEFHVNAIPFPVLVDREGRVVSFRARGPLLERHLERLLKDKK